MSQRTKDAIQIAAAAFCLGCGLVAILGIIQVLS